MSDPSAAFGDLLPAALGVAISPLPIIATVLMLLSKRAKQTATAFAVGWVVGLSVVIVAVLMVAGSKGIDTGGSSSTTQWIQTVLGLLFLALAARTWRSRPVGDQQPTAPGWMAKLDEVSPPAAFGLGALLSGVNPKNLALAITGGVAIASNDLDTTQSVVGVVLFVVVGSTLVAGPVVATLIAGERMRHPLDVLKTFMQDHNAAIMTVLLAVLGLSSLGKGLGGLLS